MVLQALISSLLGLFCQEALGVGLREAIKDPGQYQQPLPGSLGIKLWWWNSLTSRAGSALIREPEREATDDWPVS